MTPYQMAIVDCVSFCAVDEDVFFIMIKVRESLQKVTELVSATCIIK